MSLLELRGLSAGYRGVTVVRDLDLQVETGEVLCLLGANGAGKSTTLLAISGLADVQQGDVTFDGESLLGRAPDRIARSGIAHVTEDRSLFTRLTVRENLRLGGRGDLSPLPELMELFPALEPLLGRVTGSLSGGEQQMLTLARALAARPRLLLVDELSLGLAPLVVRRLLETLRAITDRGDVGVLMVEQHAELALRVADRAAVLTRGRLTLEGTTAEIAASRDRLTAAYLGEEVAS